MCQLLGISRSSYYAWRKGKPSKRAQEDEKLTELIRESHQNSGGIYGLDKVYADVREHQPCGRKRVHRLMKANGIRSIRPRKYKATTNSKHNLPVAENLLNQNFKVEKPNTVWVCNISYIRTDEGWDYLATVKDLYHKENRRLGGFQHNDPGISHPGTRKCDQEASTTCRAHPSLRSWRPILQQRLPSPAHKARYGLQHEPQGQLLRQCLCRNLF